jgi:hypothetical protein
MDDVEQRFAVKYFLIKEWGNKTMTAELQTTFRDSARSNSTVNDGSESSKWAIFHVMMILALVDLWQY